MNYGKWLNVWLRSCVKPYAKESTFEKYERIARTVLLPALGAREVGELTAPVLQTFVSRCAETRAPNTVNGILCVLQGSLKRAVKMGLAERNAAGELLRPRRREAPVECFTLAEQRRLEREILTLKRPRLFGIVLCLYTGLRIGELLALTWEDVDLSKRTVSVGRSCRDGWGGGGRKVVCPPKTEASARVIPLPRSLLPYLRKLRAGGGKYVVESGGKSPSIRSYQRTFSELLKRLNLPHRRFHALRHTFATRALECGMDVRTLSDLLGHRNPTVTLSRYAHSLTEHKSAMMEKLGGLLMKNGRETPERKYAEQKYAD